MNKTTESSTNAHNCSTEKGQNTRYIQTKDENSQYDNSTLVTYAYDEYKVVVGFGSVAHAKIYASEHNGELIEVGFTDGSDNPMENTDGNLLKEDKPFAVHLPNHPNAEIWYSYDQNLQELMQKKLFQIKKQDDDMLLEDILSDQNIAGGEYIMVTEGKEIIVITTRERIKFLMRGNVYELAVKINKHNN